MLKHVSYVAVAGWLVAPALGQPRQWVDDFKTAATYDSNSLYSTCNSGPAPKYTLIEMLLGDVYGQRAWSGNGTMTFNSRSLTLFTVLAGRADFQWIGWYGTGIPCPGSPPNGQTNEPFTSNNLCVYGGTQYNHWQCKFPGPNGWDIHGMTKFGGDGLPGVANLDDDLDGQTDEYDESPARHATSVNDGYGNINGTGFWAGRDGKPGAAGVDDNSNGVVDDVGETGWTGSDDSDDTQRMMTWVCLSSNVQDTKLFYVNFDPGATLDSFAFREILGVTTNVIEWADEIISFNYYQPEVKYNWVVCVSGRSCYGGQMWTGADMANPNETLGPVVNTRHTGSDDNMVGIGHNVHPGWAQPTVPIHYTRQMRLWGNTNFSDTFWVCSGPSSTYYPSPSADLDADKDVDGFDFLTFSNCYNGSNKPALAACTNTRADLDKDGDVDGFDFLTFSNCYNGSNKKPLAACFPPNLTTCGS